MLHLYYLDELNLMQYIDTIGNVGFSISFKIGTQSDRQFQKQGSSRQNLPTMPKYGCTLHGSLFQEENEKLCKTVTNCVFFETKSTS